MNPRNPYHTHSLWVNHKILSTYFADAIKTAVLKNLKPFAYFVWATLFWVLQKHRPQCRCIYSIEFFPESWYYAEIGECSLYFVYAEYVPGCFHQKVTRNEVYFKRCFRCATAVRRCSSQMNPVGISLVFSSTYGIIWCCAQANKLLCNRTWLTAFESSQNLVLHLQWKWDDRVDGEKQDGYDRLNL